MGESCPKLGADPPASIHQYLCLITGQRNAPYVYIAQRFIGRHVPLCALSRQQLERRISGERVAAPHVLAVMS